MQDSPPELSLIAFTPHGSPREVWRSADGEVSVDAVLVRHEPVEEAVGYRVTTPDGVVVISGDTRVCEEVETMAAGADVLVHEACRVSALATAVTGTPFETIFSYHADTVELGAMAQRARVSQTVLTHLIPAPRGADEEATFRDDLIQGGYTGRILVGHDLAEVSFGAPPPSSTQL